MQVRHREDDDLVGANDVRETVGEPREQESPNGRIGGSVRPSWPRDRMRPDQIERAIDLGDEIAAETGAAGLVPVPRVRELRGRVGVEDDPHAVSA